MVASPREPEAFARELGIFSTANSSASHAAAYVSRPRTALRSSNHAIRELRITAQRVGQGERSAGASDGAVARISTTFSRLSVSWKGFQLRFLRDDDVIFRFYRIDQENLAHFETLSFHSMKIRFYVRDISGGWQRGKRES